MQITKLKPLTKRRESIEQFLGYDHRPVIVAGSWFESENLSTDFYPLLSVRRNRAQVEDVDGSGFWDVLAVCAKEHLVVLDTDGVVHCNGHTLNLLPGTMYPVMYSVRGIFTAQITDSSLLWGILNGQDPGFYTWIYAEDAAKPWIWNGTGYTLGELGITTDPQGGPFQTGNEITIQWRKDIVPRQGVKRTMVSMGANVVIWPDKVWCNSVKLAAGGTMVAGTDYGSLEQYNTTTGHTKFTLTMCDERGNDLQRYYNGQYNSIVVSVSEPVDQAGLWMDISDDAQPVLKEWSVTISSWVALTSTYMRLEFDNTADTDNAEDGLHAGDAVTIDAKLNTSDLSSAQEQTLEKQLNGSHYIYATGDHFIVIAGIMANKTADFTVSANCYCNVSRLVPELDFVVETGNRLWGCRYGLQSGEQVNEIYCCKLGDPKNWNVFQGLSTDSYTASRGSDGPFTGAAVLDGHPLFFKENVLEKVFPSSTGAHQIQTQSLDGIQSGSGDSAVVIDDRLYYKGVGGVYVYTGTLPRLISAAFGDARYEDAKAGRHGKKYYVNMRRAGTAEYRMLVYDTVTGLWQPEDAPYPAAMATWKDVLYYVKSGVIHQIDGGSDRRGVRWHCESGVLGLDQPSRKYISKISLRYKRELGSSVRVYVQYDESGHWQLKEELSGTKLYAGTINLWPRRCDTFRLRLEGVGGFTLYSIAWEREKGSDAF